VFYDCCNEHTSRHAAEVHSIVTNCLSGILTFMFSTTKPGYSRMLLCCKPHTGTSQHFMRINTLITLGLIKDSSLLTDRRGRVVNTPSYSGGPRFKSRPGLPNILIELFRGFPQSSLGECRCSTLKLGHDRFQILSNSSFNYYHIINVI
jgi:hypothetical protein